MAVVFVCGSHTLLPLGRRDTAGDTSWELFMFLPGRVSLRPSEYVRWGRERKAARGEVGLALFCFRQRLYLIFGFPNICWENGAT